MTAIPLGRALLRGSSDLPGGLTHRADTCPTVTQSSELRVVSCEQLSASCLHALLVARRLAAQSSQRRRELPPYLVLLRVGFALPAALLPRRCALTAPFHPYPAVAGKAVCFLWHFPSAGLEPGVPDVIRHTALRSSDFPPRPFSQEPIVRCSCQNGRGDHPVRLPTLSLYAMRDWVSGFGP